MLHNLKDSFSGAKAKVAASVGTALGVVASAAPAFAADTTATYYTVSSADIAPISEAINGAMPVLIPIGVGVMATMVGISLIPRIIYKFI